VVLLVVLDLLDPAPNLDHPAHLDLLVLLDRARVEVVPLNRVVLDPLVIALDHPLGHLVPVVMAIHSPQLLALQVLLDRARVEVVPLNQVVLDPLLVLHLKDPLIFLEIPRIIIKALIKDLLALLLVLVVQVHQLDLALLPVQWEGRQDRRSIRNL